MKALLASALVLLATTSNGQLVNGSFESDGVFSLEGWEWTCEAPTPVTDTPQNGGSWSARLQMGTPDCSPSFLFQRIPFAVSGSHWTLGGWVRIDTIGWDALPRFGFSSIHNGEFPFQSQIGNPAPYWNYCWIADTVHASATDTAVVLLTCGDGFLGAGWFDSMELLPADPTGLGGTAVHLHTYLDAEQVLFLSAGDKAIRSVQVFDAAGRLRQLAQRAAAPGSVALSTDALNAGVYFVQVLTDAGPATTRFVKR